MSQSRPQSSQLRGAKRLSGGGGQSLNLSKKAAVFKRTSLLIKVAKHFDCGGAGPLASLGAGPDGPIS